jgi:AraC-like DNA-binding protein/ABC-type sugar transport system substrate-binding protein/signal transduction histidine kinase
MSRDLVVGLCDPGNDPFWLQVKDAIYQRAKHLPIHLVPISSSVPVDAQGMADQLAVIEELLALELHAVVNWGWPEQLALPVLEAGLPIVHLSETAVCHPLAVSPLGLHDAAYLAASHLVERLHGRGRVLVIGGMCQPGLPDDGRSRLEGIRAAFAPYPNIEFTHTGSTWNASAQPMVYAALQNLATPPDGIIALSDSLAIMALATARKLGFLSEQVPVVEQIPIVGINGDPLALSAITRAEMAATVETDPYVLGEQALELACLAAQHAPLPTHYPFAYQLITAQNVAAVAAKRLIATAALPNHLVDELDQIAQQRRLQLQTSLAISHRIGSLLDPDALVQEVTDIIRTQYGYDRAFLYRWDKDRQTLALAGAPLVPFAPTNQLVERSGLLAQAIFGDEAIFIPNTRRSLRFAEDPLWPDIHARVLLPIRLGGSVVGLLDLHCTRTSSHLGHEQLNELRSLADQLGIAMHNAQLYAHQSEMRVAAEKLESMKAQFMAGVSHELRSAVVAILNDATLPAAASAPDSPAAAATLAANLGRIRSSAADLLKLTDDVLDLSRAEIDDPALAPALLDLATMLAQFTAVSPPADERSQAVCRLYLPERLPLIFADPTRLGQGLAALLDYTRRLGVDGDIAISAAVELPFVHVLLRAGSDSHPSLTSNRQQTWGAELNLMLAHRFLALLGGSLAVQTSSASMVSFHVRLPLPTLSDLPASAEPQLSGPVIAISSTCIEAANLPDFPLSSRTTLSLHSPAHLEELLQHTRPGALLWDAVHAAAADWDLLLAVRRHRQLQHLPFLLYAPQLAGSVIVRGRSLSSIIAELCPTTASKSILIVDADRTLCRTYTALVERTLPGVPIMVANSAAEASLALQQARPSLVILDPQLPDCDGLELVEQLRAGEEVQHTPVLVFTCRPLDTSLLTHLAHLSPILFAGKSILTPGELAGLISRMLASAEALPPRTSDMVKQAILYIQQHFDRPLNRSDVADAISVSENYLSQIFRQEMGISLWDYLNRHRINRAKQLLQFSTQSITGVAIAVGIFDPAYFSRIFHKQVGLSPSAYRVMTQRVSRAN